MQVRDRGRSFGARDSFGEKITGWAAPAILPELAAASSAADEAAASSLARCPSAAAPQEPVPAELAGEDAVAGVAGCWTNATRPGELGAR